jgi:hypothetical protein
VGKSGGGLKELCLEGDYLGMGRMFAGLFDMNIPEEIIFYWNFGGRFAPEFSCYRTVMCGIVDSAMVYYAFSTFAIGVAGGRSWFSVRGW